MDIIGAKYAEARAKTYVNNKLGDMASAYDVWLSEGNTGTKAEYLASLVGPAGGTITDAAHLPTSDSSNVQAKLDSHTSQLADIVSDVQRIDNALETDKTLTVSGMAADAKVTGDKVGELKSALNGQNSAITPAWHYGYVGGNGVANDRDYTNANRYSDMFFAPEGTVLSSIYSKYTFVYSYTSDGTFVSALGNFKSSPKTIENDTYIRLSMELASGDATEAFNPNSYITVTVPYEKFALITALQTDVSNIQDDIVDLQTEVGSKQDAIQEYAPQSITPEAGIYNNLGNIVNAQYGNYTHVLITLTGSIQGLKVSGSCANGATYPVAVYFDVNNAVIGSEGTTTGSYIDKVLTIPSGCKYVGVSNDSNQNSAGISISALVNVSTEDYVESKISGWAGKKIVWFGTSIPAGVVNAGDAGGNGAYPTRIGEMLGATVYNEAVGSSAARMGNHVNATESDPNGYAGVPATCCLLSLSGTVAEKTAILEDWDTWNEIFTIGVDQIDTSDPDKYLNCSYERKLDKYLTGGSVGPVDMYVFDHGYNDAGNNNGVNYADTKVVPTNALDRTYFIGAMNFLIDRIKQDNYRASIVIISHYNDEGQYADLIEAQQFIADKWNIPFINISNRMGFSTARSVTINGTTKTMKDWWLPDTIHPSSDTSGKALQHYAEVLAPLLELVR